MLFNGTLQPNVRYFKEDIDNEQGPRFPKHTEASNVTVMLA